MQRNNIDKLQKVSVRPIRLWFLDCIGSQETIQWFLKLWPRWSQKKAGAVVCDEASSFFKRDAWETAAILSVHLGFGKGYNLSRMRIWQTATCLTTKKRRWDQEGFPFLHHSETMETASGHSHPAPWPDNERSSVDEPPEMCCRITPERFGAPE